MTDDLVSRLRALAHADHDDHSVADEAADEIERLRDTLTAIADAPSYYRGDWYEMVEWMCSRARMVSRYRALYELMADDADYIEKGEHDE